MSLFNRVTATLSGFMLARGMQQAKQNRGFKRALKAQKKASKIEAKEGKKVEKMDNNQLVNRLNSTTI